MNSIRTDILNKNSLPSKENLDDYLNKFSWEKSKELLFEYCDKYDKIPTQRTEYKGKKIGRWLQHQKKKINNKEDDVYITLSENKLVKENLDDYLNKFSWEESKELLFEYCDKYDKIPTIKTEYKGKKIGVWLQQQKKKINNKKDDVYIKLSENDIVKENLDDYLNPNLKWNKWKELLFEYCNENQKTPTKKTEYKGKRIGGWLDNQKKKINNTTSGCETKGFKEDDVYIVLSENKLVKENLDNYLNYKEKRNFR